MKLLHLASEYPPAKVYGLGRFVHGLARAQAAQGDDVHVLTNSHGGDEDDVVRDGVRLHRIAFPNPPRPSDGHGEVLQWNHGVVARLLDRREALRDADVIVGHDWLTAPAAREAARLLDRPLAVVVHDEVVGKHAGVLDREGRFVHALEALAVHDSNLVIANSEYIAAQVRRHYGLPDERVAVVHGGIDPGFADAPRGHDDDFRAALARDDEVLVVYVGRLDPEKGLGALTEAARLLADAAPPVRLVLAGSGRREAAVRERLGDRGRLLGYLKGEALVRLYRAADVVVVPSVYEPLGLVALEGMLCGAAVVVSDRGGLPELVRDGVDGVVVPAGDGAALARAVAALAADPAARRALGAAARRRALDAFSWEAIARRSREVYARVVGARPPLCAAPPALPPRPAVSAIVVTRQAPAGAVAAARTLLARVDGLREVVLLDHGSDPQAGATLAAAVEELPATLAALPAGTPAALLAPATATERDAEGPRVRLVRAERSVAEDAALLLALAEAASEHVLVVSDEVEALPGEEGLLDGLLWLLDDARAATVSPTLVGRAEAADARGPELAEQRRVDALPRAAYLARRGALARALAAGEGDLGARLRAAGGGAHWVHPRRLAHAAGEARRAPGPGLASAASSPLPASIVVVAYGQEALTRECLESVLAHTAPPFELVLVDNGSRDGVRRLFEAVRAQAGPATPVQLVVNRANLGYPVAANQGVRAARGRHVVLLNNDARVRPGWLAALLAAAEGRPVAEGTPDGAGPADAGSPADGPAVGIVTAKVLNLDLTVQSAGGILHAPDGTFVIPGQGLPRGAPEVSQRRRVPSAGGPCMLLTRELLERLVAATGTTFDEAYSPGYFEDSDLCLRARAAGLALVYEPGAEVVHHGKATASLVAREGTLDVWGRFEENRRRFHARWAAQLARDAATGPDEAPADEPAGLAVAAGGRAPAGARGGRS